MNLLDVFQNKALVAGLIAWSLAQVIKIPLDFFRTRRWNWALFFTTGGMPSSHSSLITATTLAVGLYYGFDNPVFALGVAITMIVTYDAAGVRQQAGIHARRINVFHPQNQTPAVRSGRQPRPQKTPRIPYMLRACRRRR